MHPMVKPALRRAWRERQTVQFGVTPAHAVAVGPMDTATGTLLQLFDGTRGLPLLRAEARAMGLPEGRTDALVNRLSKAGLLDDPTAGGVAADALRRKSSALDRLRPDLASLSVVHREPGGGIRQLAARHSMRVQVRGAGRVGATVAALLSAAGVGQVDVLDGGCAQPWDVAPGGLPAKAVGERRDSAVRQVVHRCAPLRSPRAVARTKHAPSDMSPSPVNNKGAAAIDGDGTAQVPAGGPIRDRMAGSGEPGLTLIVICPRDGLAAYAPEPDSAQQWITSGIPHLYAGVVEATGVIGPLVLPGGSACAGCLERGRADRDPGWPRLLAQWRSGGRRAAVPACDISLATTVAGLTAAHALSFLDGDLPMSVGARWEVALPALTWRCEPITPHKDCGCGSSRKSEGAGTSAPGEVTRH
ncbi:ThiF family adenylyltransferase [Streptomyces albipurpureus]|uniref:ThiF family adenylyltransferase n=1 Tax=Streptomyces albipurpureus TaxID=2897419 RepID=A0ABT0UK69_9ACTN|nr:ThiF family adenylyltransferase [Streptomyces sp. CWNU-1]MCM2389032.1 ThiF family adenylyltransferase [Streptomyces sp. CWNU-1]